MYKLAIIAAASLAATFTAFTASTASAHTTYYPDHSDYTDRAVYPDRARPGIVRLAEVSADPRDGIDTIELRDRSGLRGFTHLELRARTELVDIHGLGLRLPDGHVAWLNVREQIAPGELRRIELPYEARRAEAILVDYGAPAYRLRDRTQARLELYGTTRYDARGAARYDARGAARYDARDHRATGHRRVIYLR